MAFYFVPIPETYNDSNYPFWGYHIWDATPQLSTTNDVCPPILFGAFTPTKHISPTQQNGWFLRSLYDDVYGYVHISDSYFNVGTLMADKTFEFELWNANFYESERLNSLGQYNTEGILFEGPLSYPYIFSPMEAQNYRIKVTVNGPPTINARYTLNFDEYSLPILIEGKRLVVFYWMPKYEHSETLEWLTDLIETYSDEQRIALRVAPRCSITYNYVKTPDEAAAMTTLTKAWVYRNWGVPVWVEATNGISATAGVTSINFNTSYASYKDAAFIWESDVKNEALNILTLRADGIDIDQPLKYDYDNALIMPLKFGITPDGVSFEQSYNAVKANVTFVIIDDDYIGANTLGTYDGYPIIDKNFMVQSINERIYRQSEYIDNGQGLIAVEPNRSIIEKTSILGKITNTKADLWNWRKFLHYMMGRKGVFLLPTFQKDVTLLEILYSGATSARIKGLALSNFGTFPIRTQIELKDGTIYYRKITSVSPIPDSNDEFAIIDSSFTFDLNPEDIARWSFIDLVRFDADSITMDFEGMIMKCAIPVKVVSA